jgi:hypothetical protein
MLSKTINVISSVSEKSTNSFSIVISHASFEGMCLFTVLRNIS